VTLAQLHDQDFAAWADATAKALRQGTLAPADATVVAEEVEDMGKSERRKLHSHMTVLLQHLLKWRAQPDLRDRSWQVTIAVQRQSVPKLLEDSPSLRRDLEAGLATDFADAVELAATEMGHLNGDLPHVCPWSLDEVLTGALEG
jgi:hypothetical protein